MAILSRYRGAHTHTHTYMHICTLLLTSFDNQQNGDVGSSDDSVCDNATSSSQLTPARTQLTTVFSFFFYCCVCVYRLKQKRRRQDQPQPAISARQQQPRRQRQRRQRTPTVLHFPKKKHGALSSTLSLSVALCKWHNAAPPAAFMCAKPICFKIFICSNKN